VCKRRYHSLLELDYRLAGCVHPVVLFRNLREGEI
jgi:hypothetical protein